MNFDTIGDLRDIKGAIHRRSITPHARGRQPLPLISGTESFASAWLRNWHREVHFWEPSDVACYSVLDAIVSGAGNVWIAGSLVTSPEIMPPYVAKILKVSAGGSEQLNFQHTLPVRSISRPCVVAVGHGIKVYGHFLIEMLFRILVARRAFGAMNFRYGILLDGQAPGWLLDILTQDLHIDVRDLEFFDSSIEQVHLRHAILPGRVFLEGHIHPVANELVEEFLQSANLPRSNKKRLFVTRGRFSNPAAPHRICTNESSLAEMARVEHAFEVVVPERLPWREQIALFQHADIILGQAGSGMHTALFCRPDSRLLSIGVMNLVQAEIGALRAQQTAYFSEGVSLSGEFSIDEAAFRRFLHSACAP